MRTLGKTKLTVSLGTIHKTMYSDAHVHIETSDNNGHNNHNMKNNSRTVVKIIIIIVTVIIVIYDFVNSTCTSMFTGTSCKVSIR